ncbi:MAG: hypothetical protein GKR93_14825 [Gammaproteobacteria bacterium]|nr:hypothetical protein [Gammaproteobacteria bacterium]
MRIPFWLKLSILLVFGISLGVWFSGESTRKLNSEYLVQTIRQDMQRTTGLLAGIIVDSVIVRNHEKTESLIRQYASSWENFTYIHVLDDEGLFVAEWQKRPIKFGPGIRKFEQEIEHGGQIFGILSVYVDMGAMYTSIDNHINSSRRQSALILLSLTMFIVFFINYFALKEENENK